MDHEGQVNNAYHFYSPPDPRYPPRQPPLYAPYPPQFNAMQPLQSPYPAHMPPPPNPGMKALTWQPTNTTAQPGPQENSQGTGQ